MVEQRLDQRLADAFAAMLRPDDDVRYACEHGAVTRSAGEADLLAVDQRDGTDGILEGAAVNLIGAPKAPIVGFQEIGSRLEIEVRLIEADFETGHGIHAMISLVGVLCLPPATQTDQHPMRK